MRRNDTFSCLHALSEISKQLADITSLLLKQRESGEYCPPSLMTRLTGQAIIDALGKNEWAGTPPQGQQPTPNKWDTPSTSLTLLLQHLLNSNAQLLDGLAQLKQGHAESECQFGIGMTWKGQKVKEELAALRLGYLGQELCHRQRSALQAVLQEVKEVQTCLREIDQALALLSSRVNDYQRAQVADLWDRLASRHDGACGYVAQIWMELFAEVGEDPEKARRSLADRITSDDGIQAWKTWQEEDWREVHNLLQGVVAFDGKCGPWFETGHHLGDAVFRLLDNRLAVPLSPQAWDDLYAGVDRLPPRVQRRLGTFFPAGYNDAHHLALQLAGTFRGICALLDGEEYGLDAVPKWDGTNLIYRNRRATIRVTKNTVIVPVLDELERNHWPDRRVALPSGLRGDVKQAVYNFNKQYRLVRLTLVGGEVGWRP
jgi:hypothetical protein